MDVNIRFAANLRNAAIHPDAPARSPGPNGNRFLCQLQNRSRCFGPLNLWRFRFSRLALRFQGWPRLIIWQSVPGPKERRDDVLPFSGRNALDDFALG